MARSNARAGPSQPSQTQRTRAGRARVEDEDEEEEENNDNEDEEEEEEMAMNVDHDDEPGSVRYDIDLLNKRKETLLNYRGYCRNSLVELTISFV